MCTTSNKTMQETLYDIYIRLGQIENYLGDNNSTKDNVEVNVDLNVNTSAAMNNITEVKEELEELSEIAAEIELPDIHPIINFYGCSFNFANEGCAESRYYGGDDIYNPRKEV